VTEEDALDLFDALDEARAEPETSPAEPRVWSVAEINSAVRALLEDSLPPVWVVGEVANWTRARSGHCYFTLKDDRAQLRCVMWRTHASRLPIDPEEGMRLRAFGRLTLYEARGEYQLGVLELRAEGEEGLWKLAFERLRVRLEEEGLLDPARKRRVPRFPRTVGVVTSTTGAALRDILSVIRRRAPWTRVLVRGTRVQGEGASTEIAQALRLLAGSGRVDVVIVGRGGGSIEDLWAFNEEPVARAIAESPVPVISAVGHETDVTISDLVADLRAPTPSAAAEAAVLDGAALLEVLAAIRPRLARGLRGQMARRRVRVERLRHDLERRMARSIERRRERLARAAAQVEALSPLATLRRGYAVALTPGGGVLRTAASFREHTSFQLRVVDGRIDCETRGIRPDAER
jgi:exodeoxyribonuclease VII large subunit